MRRSVCAASLGVALLLPLQRNAQQNGYVPSRGFVPDSLTAVRIAVAVWDPIYGERQIGAEAPYHASLHGGIWTVDGTLNCGGNACVGGVAVAQIAKRDGRILRVSHGK